MQTLSALQLGVFEKLTELVADEPLLYLQYAQAAETAQDYETAITAYESFLDVSPNNPNAEQIQERIDALRRRSPERRRARAATARAGAPAATRTASNRLG